MLNRIIEFSVKNKLIVGLFTFILIGYGAYQVTKLPIDAVPDITDNQVQIITTSPALGAPDVERFITFPIEQVNNNIPGLKQIRSFSRFGLSVVTLVFNDGVDVYWARQQVAERLQIAQNQIPKEFGAPTMAPITTGLGEIYQYMVRPKSGYENKYSITQLRTIQDWIVRRQLLGVQGVADVASFGGFLKQYEIAINPSRLAANKISISEVFDALAKNNQNTGGAYIEKGPTALFIRSEGLVGSIPDIENIVVKNVSNGTPILIRDIAKVAIGHATRYGAMTYNGKGEVAGAVVMMLKGANSNEVIKNVKERIAQIQKTLPEGVIVDAFLDRTKMVNNAIHTVSKNLVEGALIVLFVLILFLGNFRAGILVASVIPLAMLFAIIMMNIFGVSGNLMSLGALDFGLIIDGAVIIVEAVLHSLTHSKKFSHLTHLSQKEMNHEVQNSASKMMNSAVFGQIIILIVYLPILTLEGIEGKMFKPMAQTVAFALIGAFLLSITYVPMMSSLFLSKKVTSDKNWSARMMEKLENFYQNSLGKVMNYKKIVLAALAFLLIVAAFILSNLGGEFIPTLPEGDFAVDTRVLPGSNLNTSIKALGKSQKLLLAKFPEIKKIVGKTGSSEIPTDPMPLDASDMIIILKDRSEWTSADNYDDLAAKMSAELKQIPGVTYSFQYPVAMRFNELMTGARQDVVCKIFGEDIDTLAAYAQKLGNICSKVEGSQNLYVEPVSGMPQIVIKYNRSAIAKYGLSISDINNAVNTGFAGQSTGQVYENEKRFDLVVRLENDQRENLADVQNLLLNTSQGVQIPLSAVAEVSVKNDINQIQREDAQRRIIVGFNVRNRDIQTTVNDLQEKVNRQLKLPTGYYITYGGAFQNLQEAKSRLSIAVPVSLILIFLLLYFAFNSVKYGLLIYTAIPFSAIGGILALSLRGMPFSISAGIGFIALFGVAVLNGIVLIAEFNQLRHHHQDTPLIDIVMKGGKTRLRPVLMTALVASLGFLPMALSTGEGAEVQRPLATVVIGGLILATFLTLYVLPILYIFFEKKWKPKKEMILPLLILGFIGFSQSSQAQEKITLKAAIDSALQNNLSLKSGKLKVNELEQLKGTAWNIPQTSVNYEYGKFNTNQNDDKLFINQSIKFPTIYTAQKNLNNKEWQRELAAVSLKENELKKQVSLVFDQLIYLREKKKLLQESDEIFSSFLKKAKLRLEQGESNILEKTTAESQRGQIAMQLKALTYDERTLLLQFQRLIHSSKVYFPQADAFKLELLLTSDSSQLAQHPSILMLDKATTISESQLKLERNKLLPDLLLGYNNMSIYGTGNPNQRFESFQVGIGIPLFFSSQKASIKAAKVVVSLNENSYKDGLEYIRNTYLQEKENYQKNLETVDYYENIALKNADIITKTADEQFSNGEINYLNWVILMNNALVIKDQYLVSVSHLNESIIILQSLINK
ncbi:MAG: CusA/CzcA family heavy metal efflux RND transporter [Bacteroidetes bacterium]|nr:CusA/CzcA family heavy metal efflux RND transporter [Bacteroidota bacterium]MBU1486177.1 CusA/CzcA family heavy metal efflux RND transporter [Bacteroidota bacterium]MBU2267055.1 CusA/CzcA family heavy metal efflux RND transporter [Bacteroidota bacterium]MBU2376564.1 CusA/CzcA family heavy metal efflux RND transporter [Bacteroidota bacterium]